MPDLISARAPPAGPKETTSAPTSLCYCPNPSRRVWPRGRRLIGRDRRALLEAREPRWPHEALRRTMEACRYS
jgi:hypothetical protein